MDGSKGIKIYADSKLKQNFVVLKSCINTDDYTQPYIKILVSINKYYRSIFFMFLPTEKCFNELSTFNAR